MTLKKHLKPLSSKDRFIAACCGNHTDRPPVWIMRQAGRTLPEFRALRQNHAFWDVCRSPELAAEVTLQPLRRFPLDAAVLFSDILTIPLSMGFDVQFKPKLTVSPAIRSASDISGLKVPNVRRDLQYTADAVKVISRELAGEKALLGFSGAPYTLACYMVDGGSAKTFARTRALMTASPLAFKQLMTLLSEAIIDYLAMQIEAGATAVQLFDTWATELSAAAFTRHVLPHLQTIVQTVQKLNTPVIYYINGIGNLVESAIQTGADVLGVDWRISLKEVRRRAGTDIPVQGNLDPAILLSNPQTIQAAVDTLINETGGHGHIVNLGHGIQPETPLENIRAFVHAVTERQSP